MKAHITYVASQKLLELLEAAGFTHIAQSGFLKVEPVKGRRIYVANTKRVGRVDISGFEVDPSIGKTPEGGPFGAVKQQLRFDGTEDDVLTRFANLLTELSKQEPVAPKPSAPKAKKAAKSTSSPDAPEGAGTEPGEVEPSLSPKEEAELRLSAIRRIKDMAAKMKANVSQKVLDEEATLMNKLIELESSLIAEGTVEAPAPTA